MKQLYLLIALILLLIAQCMGVDSITAGTGSDAAGRKNDDSGNVSFEPDPVRDLMPTPSAAEGPYFKPGSPERTSLLEPGVAGDRINITGKVLTRSGKPVAGALIDFWQADGNGVYDNADYGLRGRQYTDEQGRYRLETVLPGNYGGRTRHIHVKVQAPDGAVLTTQLFFPGEDEDNQRDSIFNPMLLVSLNETNTGTGTDAIFDFVLDMK